MKTKLNLLFLLCFVLFACEDAPDLSRTSWKLTGIFHNGKKHPPVPDCDNCYILKFTGWDKLEATASASTFSGTYTISASTLKITTLESTTPDMEDVEDGILFVDALKSAGAFEIKGGSLILYFGKKNHLIFSEYSDKKNDIN
ncbi:MAG: META domain-containing protein [Dysgonamonadaceae bacterium]|jgi:hypothetical protein|nr:META domain-containing protein [Dysgonamonadaceae bacterium]